MYKLSNVLDNQDTLGYIGNEGGFPTDLRPSLKDYTFLEYTLEELGLPSAQELLNGVLEIEREVGLQGWLRQGQESKNYRGFSLTYNPDFLDSDHSIYHQTWGSNNLTQIFGRKLGHGTHKQIKNTYYDSYAFRIIPPLVEKHLGNLLGKFSCPLIRSRVAYYNMYGRKSGDSGWHVDEPPYHLFRMNIPLKTSSEYFVELKGEDDFGNSYDYTTHLEVGKAYFWNTRIPHRVGTSTATHKPSERIHLVLGFSPWFNFNPEEDAYEPSENYGKSIASIIKNKLYLK